MLKEFGFFLYKRKKKKKATLREREINYSTMYINLAYNKYLLILT
jgi:hypothetical protein